MSSRSATLRPIIMVDDSPDDLIFARRRLEKAGVRNPVLTFLSSADALAHLEALARRRQALAELLPSVVFLDLNMPKIPGLELLRRIRREKAFADVRVVMLSSSEDPRDRRQAEQLGADQFWIKFPGPDAFAEVLSS